MKVTATTAWVGLASLFLCCATGCPTTMRQSASSIPPTYIRLEQSLGGAPESTQSLQRRLIQRQLSDAAAIAYAITPDWGNVPTTIASHQLLMHGPLDSTGESFRLSLAPPALGSGAYLDVSRTGMIGLRVADVSHPEGFDRPFEVLARTTPDGPSYKMGTRIRAGWVVTNGQELSEVEAVAAGKNWLMLHAIQSLIGQYVQKHDTLPTDWMEVLTGAGLAPLGYTFHAPQTAFCPSPILDDLALEVHGEHRLLRITSRNTAGIDRIEYRKITWSPGAEGYESGAFEEVAPHQGWIYLGGFAY